MTSDSNMRENFILLPGKAGDPLAKEISEHLGVELGSVDCVRFRGKGILGGETKQIIAQNLRGKAVYIIWSILNTNDELVQVLQLISTIKRTGKAQHVVLVVPDYPYARQDKSHARRECISARLIADLLDAAGLDHIITMSLHSEQIEGFSRSLDHLKDLPLVAHYLSTRYDEICKHCGLIAEENNIAIMAPDEGGVRRAEEFGRNLRQWKGLMAFAAQQRDRDVIHKKNLLSVVGDVSNKIVVIPDDILATGSTLFNAAAAARKAGAKHIIGFCTHALGLDSLSKDGETKKTFPQALAESELDEIVVTDSRPDFVDQVLKEKLLRQKVSIISIVPYLAEAIRRDLQGNTIKEMIRGKDIQDLYSEKHRCEPA
ncbi:ribose-phosphate diphosphokinase [Acidobacteriota bacterium]